MCAICLYDIAELRSSLVLSSVELRASIVSCGSVELCASIVTCGSVELCASIVPRGSVELEVMRCACWFLFGQYFVII